ncbi:MAG: DNA repair protein RecO [Clostridiales bacterium]|nr:DNA repair protein RecO [Clostridiales bacterium]
MEEKQNGIVLSGINFSENDKLLNIFTLNKGVVCAKIKGVKKAGAKLKFAAEPFCFAEYIFSKSGDKRTVIGASLIDSFYPIRENIQKFFCAGTVTEFIKHFYQEEMVDEKEFMLTINALKEIAYTDDYLSALVKFLVLALENQGFGLKLDGCFCCENKIEKRTFFDYRNGAFICEKCFDNIGREINGITLSALIEAKDGSLTDEHQGTKKALKLLEYYIKNRTEENIKSLKELNDILT